MPMVSNEEWQFHHARLVANCAKREKAWRIFMSRTYKLAAIADPRTGGNETLCRNWGNTESVRIWNEAWPKWWQIRSAYDRRYNAILRTMTGRPA